MTERSESERAELVALDPLEMLLDAARYAEGNGGKYRNLEWAKAARAAVAKARLVATDHGGADAGVEEKLQVSKCDDGTWMVHTEGDIIAYAGQGDEEGKMRRIAAAISHHPAPVAANASAEARLRELEAENAQLKAQLIAKGQQSSDGWD